MRKQLKLLIAAESFKRCAPHVNMANEAGYQPIARTCASMTAIERLTESEKPDAVLIDASGIPDVASKIIKKISALGNAPKIIAIVDIDGMEAADEMKSLGAEIIVSPADPRLIRYLIADMCGIGFENGDDDLESRIAAAIREIGVPVHIRGYKYLKDAVLLTIRNPHMLEAVSKELYPAIAKLHGVSKTSVESGIRHGVDHAYEAGGLDAFAEKIGYKSKSFKNGPTNIEIIAVIADYIENS